MPGLREGCRSAYATLFVSESDTPSSYHVAAYITVGGTGFAQQQFSISCKQGGFVIDHEALAVARFSKDLARDHSQAEKVEDPTRFLAYAFPSRRWQGRTRSNDAGHTETL